MKQIQITILLDNDVIVSPQDIVVNVVNTSGPPTNDAGNFFAFTDEIVKGLKENAQLRTAETYLSAVNCLRRYTGTKPVDLDDIDAGFLTGLESFLKEKGLAPNTISFYMRRLRAIYNRAVGRGLTADRRPFDGVFTSIAQTEKRAIGLDIIRKIRDYLSDNEQDIFARDMFMFSFYTQGMAPIDMAYLRKTDIVDHVLTYRRKKTGQTIRIHWEDYMQELVDRHPSATDNYLLPLISKSNGKPRNQIRWKLQRINSSLKRISSQLLLERPVTMYAARHSWASIARTLHVPMDVISMGMGHESEKTTRIYLKCLDHTPLFNANKMIFEALK